MVMTVTQLELKTLLLQKKREGQEQRVEHVLQRNLAKTESAEARHMSHQDQGECRDGPRNRKASI